MKTFKGSRRKTDLGSRYSHGAARSLDFLWRYPSGKFLVCLAMRRFSRFGLLEGSFVPVFILLLT